MARRRGLEFLVKMERSFDISGIEDDQGTDQGEDKEDGDQTETNHRKGAPAEGVDHELKASDLALMLLLPT
jgi:hypothetical protein